MTENEVKAIFEIASAKREAANEAREQMAAVLLSAMRKLLPPGTLLELNKRPLPAYLVHVKTMSGSDRGTRTFRVVSVVSVEADATYPDLSKWICDAVPVSEKTGRDMSASTHAATRSTVRLHGNFGWMGDDASLDEIRTRLAKLVAEHA